MRQRLRRTGLGLAVAVCLSTWAASTSGAVDLSGRWRFVGERSDDVRAKIDAAVGSELTSGDAREDVPRVWIRSWLMRQAEQPGSGVLTIEQTAREFRSGLGDESRTYYFGRESTRQGPGGGLRKAAVRWNGDVLVVEETAKKGSGRIVEEYRLEPDGRHLVVHWRLEHKALVEPLDLTLSFEKAQP